MKLATRLRTRGDVTELPLGSYFTKAPGYDPCKACDGPYVLTFQAGRSGGSFGSSYLHEESCRELRCPHGVIWTRVNEGKCRSCNHEEDERARAFRVEEESEDEEA